MSAAPHETDEFLDERGIDEIFVVKYDGNLYYISVWDGILGYLKFARFCRVIQGIVHWL